MRLVILGGGFCGASVARLLDTNKTFEITLIDKTPYFEYTPNIHKIPFHPDYYQRLISPYSQFLRRCRILIDPILQVTPHSVVTPHHTIEYDYLVIATGINYPILLKDKRNVFTIKSVANGVQLEEKLQNATKILVIGGGLIGTEIAGELATKARHKRLTIVHARNRLLERTPFKASQYAQRFLEKRGANIIFAERVLNQENGNFTTNTGRRINADIGIWSAGINYNPEFMQGFSSSTFTEQKALKVNQKLQLKGYPNIFVGGDITSLVEEKTAQNAEYHAQVIATNLKRLIAHQSLRSYFPRPRLMAISLGDYHGILTSSNFTITGPLAGFIKQLAHRWIIRQYQ